MPPWITILVITVIVLVVLALFFFVFRSRRHSGSRGAGTTGVALLQPTSEVWGNPETGQRLRVWFTPRTGQREYRTG